MRLLSQLLPASASSRAHPDPTIDVWELAVWDPLPLALEVYTLFSPGHAVVYWLLLPVAGDARPSLTVVTALVLQALLSVQMGVLVQNFQQKEKDGRVIHKEVLNEYDTKFVHPTLHPVVRDVGTQISTSIAPPPATTSTSTGTDAPDFDPDASTISITAEEITTHAPTTILRRGFKINPNPNYAAHISPHAPSAVPSRTSLPPSTPHTPVGQTAYQPTPASQQQVVYQQPQFQQQQQPQVQRRDSTPLRATPGVVGGQRQYRASMGGRIGSDGSINSGAEEELVRRAVGGSSGLSRVSSGSGDELRGRSREFAKRGPAAQGDGGSLGVYSHAQSPLKKASSMYDITRSREAPRNGAQAAAREVTEERERVRRRGV
ncbi:hypothetical protein V492_05727 [Pseudogymnoascus sp. VKM F-4246]|nr:hypothetical protein V492_05727 [Pseudogymnoascus sp. VKM F-4246]